MIENTTISENPAGEGGFKKRKRALLLLLLGILLIGLLVILLITARTLMTRKPITSLPVVSAPLADIPPHYLFSIFNVSQPVGVAFSSDGERIYVAESGGERLIRVFGREGQELFSFAPPGTTPATRTPTFIAVGEKQVYVTDRMQHGIFVFDLNGNYQDMIYAAGGLISDWARSPGTDNAVPEKGAYAHLVGEPRVIALRDGLEDPGVAAPDHGDWQPLGIRLVNDDLYVTDVTNKHHRLVVLKARTAEAEKSYGHEGGELTQLSYPNAALVDPLGRTIVSDGNNGRLVVLDQKGKPSVTAQAGTPGGVGLPGGLAIDENSRLYVADSVNHAVEVYDVSGKEIGFIFSFGDEGTGAGQLRFPSDVAADATGRVVVSDTRNDRVTVWTY